MLNCKDQNKWRVHAETYTPHSVISYLGEAGCLASQGRETVPWRQVWALRSQVKPLGQQWVWSVQHTACIHFYTKKGWLIVNIYQQNISYLYAELERYWLLAQYSLLNAVHYGGGGGGGRWAQRGMMEECDEMRKLIERGQRGGGGGWGQGNMRDRSWGGG